MAMMGTVWEAMTKGYAERSNYPGVSNGGGQDHPNRQGQGEAEKNLSQRDPGMPQQEKLCSPTAPLQWRMAAAEASVQR